MLLHSVVNILLGKWAVLWFMHVRNPSLYTNGQVEIYKNPSGATAADVVESGNTLLNR